MPRHPLIPTFTPGSRTVLKSAVMNRMRRSVIANANLSVSGDARLHSSATGDHIAVSLTGRCWLFELTESVQWPDASRTGGDEDEPDVPWADNCKPVYYEPWTGTAKNIYDAQSYPKARTIYWPLCIRNSQGIAVGRTHFLVGDRTWCIWNRQSGRFESLESVDQGLVRCCLAQNHPGRGKTFDVYVGTWSPGLQEWLYDETETQKAIDWWYSDTGPYPEQGATGMFKAMPSTTYGVIYEVQGVLDCDVPPDHSCSAASTGTGT